MRRARHVRDDAARGEGAERRVEQFALQGRERGYVGGLLAPARFGAPAERAEARARGIHEDAVVAAAAGAHTSVLLRDRHLERHPGDGVAHEARAGRGQFIGFEQRAVGEGLGGEDRRFAAGGGAQVEPALPLAHRERASEG